MVDGLPGVIRRGHMRSSRAVSGTAVALTLSLGLAACTPATGSSTPETTPTAPTATASSPSETPASPEPTAREHAAELWTAVHEQRLGQVFAADEPDDDAFTAVATPEASETLLALVHAARADVPTELVGVEHWPDITVAADGSASIADCILVATRPTNSDDDPTVRTQVWTGRAAEIDGTWLLSELTVGEDDCVPAELNRELLDAYIAYHEAWTAAWDPPDPDHPLLEKTMTGERLTGIRTLLEQDRDAGVAFRDPHDPSANAVVFELGIGRATVSDCHEAHPGYGAFDLDSGERLDDETPPVEPGEMHLTSVDLVRTGEGAWKVTDAALLTDSNCMPGGSRYVVAP
jgi:hypothetical protein